MIPNRTNTSQDARFRGELLRFEFQINYRPTASDRCVGSEAAWGRS
jgi:hypothetical protein